MTMHEPLQEFFENLFPDDLQRRIILGILRGEPEDEIIKKLLSESPDGAEI